MLKSICLIILIGVACSLNAQNTNPDVIISMSKTQCFGSCPAFKFELYSDLSVHYTGIAYVDLIGNYMAKLTTKQYDDILQEFEDSDFFQFEDRYYKEVSDLPTTYLFYSDGEQGKKIMDYYGAPEKLKELETKIEDLITHVKWDKKPIKQ